MARLLDDRGGDLHAVKEVPQFGHVPISGRPRATAMPPIENKLERRMAAVRKKRETFMIFASCLWWLTNTLDASH